MTDTSWRTEEWLRKQIAYIEEARDNGRYNHNEARKNIEKYWNEIWLLNNSEEME